MLLWWFVLSTQTAPLRWAVILAVIVLALWSSGRAEQSLGRDARPIIIDELAGQWVALAACQKRVFPAVMAFLLFRVFDIWKPFPIRVSQRLPGGWGVVVDDLIAGVYAVLVLLIIGRLWLG